MTLDVRRMLLLAEVAGHGSITAAAQAMAYTASAVSQQIAKLEVEAGQPLLERHARGVELTLAGRAVVEHAQRIDRQLRAARAELDDIAGLRSGELRIGSFPTAGSSLLPLVVRRLGRAHPAVSIVVRSAQLAGLRNMLESREIELGLLWDYDWSRVDDPSLALTPLLSDPTALIVSQDHPLADRTSVNLRELAGESWITRADAHPVAEVLARSAHAAGFEPQIAFHAHDYQEAQAMVAIGLGMALAPRLALTNLRSGIAVIPLTSAPTRRILLARLAARRPTPTETAAERVFVEVGQSLAARAATRIDHPGAATTQLPPA
ncbi:LysR substrate-binding domain-containing protein [Actinoalloteichus hymeniacidonis]|uniref:Transcriptional regulator n=1 Tax=Actinoalloteichus hymeniacidonis TaxID=340345 RepID=A0AAC9HW08_9PSEU|nr:LysR substrate-binding domain-containing protein [Actinoalloteichus hymeniacidonis]AOS65525.1 transcriptional regulator [Actinoalloteichus hymeniacidonis]MBB5906387.1 DNA-binding transcriptional LysR family regulator [Actinoalloteichus hymeniacidonis]